MGSKMEEGKKIFKGVLPAIALVKTLSPLISLTDSPSNFIPVLFLAHPIVSKKPRMFKTWPPQSENFRAHQKREV